MSGQNYIDVKVKPGSEGKDPSTLGSDPTFQIVKRDVQALDGSRRSVVFKLDKLDKDFEANGHSLPKDLKDAIKAFRDAKGEKAIQDSAAILEAKLINFIHTQKGLKEMNFSSDPKILINEKRVDGKLQYFGQLDDYHKDYGLLGNRDARGSCANQLIYEIGGLIDLVSVPAPVGRDVPALGAPTDSPNPTDIPTVHAYVPRARDRECPTGEATAMAPSTPTLRFRPRPGGFRVAPVLFGSASVAEGLAAACGCPLPGMTIGEGG